MSAMFTCYKCQQPYLIEGTNGQFCNQCIYGTSKASAETVSIWDVLPTYKDYHEISDEDLVKLESENKQLREKLNEAIKALEFYADEKNWRDIVEEESYGNNCGLERGCFDSIIYEDCENDIGGKLARTTLKAIKGMG